MRIASRRNIPSALFTIFTIVCVGLMVLIAQSKITYAQSTDTAKIVVYRGIATVGLLALSNPKIKLDGKKIGKCRRKDKVEIILDPGNYTVSMQTDIVANLNIDIAAGETIYIQCLLLPIGILMPAPALKRVSEKQAIKRVSKIPVQN